MAIGAIIGEALTLEIHHGGDFVDIDNRRFEYVGGEICWMEFLDPDRTSWIELNAFTWRLGYRVPLVLYLFKHPTDDVFWQTYGDMDAVKMLELLPQSRIIKVYYVGGGTRQIKLCELEDQMKNYEEMIPYIKFKPKVRSLPLYGTCYLEVEIDKKVNKGKQKEKVVALVGANNEEEHNNEEHKVMMKMNLWIVIMKLGQRMILSLIR